MIKQFISLPANYNSYCNLNNVNAVNFSKQRQCFSNYSESCLVKERTASIFQNNSLSHFDL